MSSIENITSFARSVFITCSIVHLLSVLRVMVQGYEARNKGEIIEVFLWLPIEFEPVLSTLWIGALGIVLIVASVTDTAIYTAAVMDELEARKELDALFHCFKSVMMLVEICLFKSLECPVY